MNFPQISEGDRISRLQPPTGSIRMVLDTDTYNEIDDQFAVVYTLLSKGKLDLEAIYAAPFFNARSTNPEDGMEKSFLEIQRLLELMSVPSDRLVFKGSPGFLSNIGEPHYSPAALDLVERAMGDGSIPLHVVAIGAITNIASAILIEPSIVDRIVVVWLGGQPLHWRHTHEFNLQQDIIASRLMFDCGVPLVHIPCLGVTSHLRTTVPEIDRYVQGQGPIGDYLAGIFKAYHVDHLAWSKEIWDIVTLAYLINPEWVLTDLVHSPILTDHCTWSFDTSRHLIRSAYFVYRDPIFRDFFTKLKNHADQSGV